MLEAQSYRKNKINLADYDYEKDIRNRLLMANFSSKDIIVLEEILYSPLKFPISRITNSLGFDKETVDQVLEQLLQTELFFIDNEEIIVNKEMRKYFEAQLLKFEEDFKPGMDFLQSLLKKVPIHVLPSWYPIPRTSNNIFESLIEKYLQTPQVFQRYLSELNFTDPAFDGIINDVLKDPNYQVSSKTIMEKYSLDQTKFEEYMLYLEFNFVCCLVYKKQGDEWSENVTLFQEWRDYLSFLNDTEPKEIETHSKIKRKRPHDFSFIQDMTALINLTKENCIYLIINDEEQWIPEKETTPLIAKACGEFDLESEEGLAHFNQYISSIIKKLLFLNLAEISKRQIKALKGAKEWLSLPLQERSITTYRSTLSLNSFSEFPPEICTERNIHEIENSIKRIIGSGWVYFDNFMEGIVAPISEKTKMMLTKTGKYWKYSIPDYSKEEKMLIKRIIFDFLFEGGIIATGTHQGRECFSVTPLGESMFG